MIQSLINMGIETSMPKELIRKIRATNLLILTLIVACILLLLPITIEHGLLASPFIFASALLLIVLLFVHNMKYYNMVRVFIAIFPSILILIASIIIKSYDETPTVEDYFSPKILMTGTFVLPFILFWTNERNLLFRSAIGIFLVTIGFDLIHYFFGVGYQQLIAPMSMGYIVVNIYISIVLVFIAGALYYFKKDMEKLLKENYKLDDHLGEKSVELVELHEELQMANARLKEEVSLKTMECKNSNKELLRRNNDLQQFSSTLSHNLRGSVANIIGLSTILKMEKNDDENVVDQIIKSSKTLEDVIKDLNKTIEIRNNLTAIKEKIEIKREIESIDSLLDDNTKQHNTIIKLDIKENIIFGVRSYFHSILYNLISNAIKYKHQERDAIIKISADKVGDKYIIIVADNGSGIDLNKHGEKIFGMYKRFHTHLEGKGLGLFLTKQQVETMGGSISIESNVNVGTTFTIELPIVPLSKIENQLLYKSELANVYLDSINHITTLVWKKSPTPPEFTEIFTDNIKRFSSYNCAKWIVDTSAIVQRQESDKKWVLEDAIVQNAEIGIKNMLMVKKYDPNDNKYWEEFARTSKRHSISVQFANSIDEAKEILLKIN